MTVTFCPDCKLDCGYCLCRVNNRAGASFHLWIESPELLKRLGCSLLLPMTVLLSQLYNGLQFLA